MKSVWSGTISFGLVTIPVQLYSAINKHTFGFKMLCGVCHQPLKYERWCQHCKKEVAWDETVKGLPQANGSYFVVTQEALEKLKPEKTDAISLQSFVPFTAIAPIYYEDHYYLVPTKQGAHAFHVLQVAMQKTGLSAIGQFVMRDKEYVCALQVYQESIMLSTLHYSYEIRTLETVARKAQAEKVSAQEVRLAEQIIKQITTKEFDISKYKDTFVQKLKKALKAGPPKIKKTSAKAKQHKKPTFLDLLEGSLQQGARR